MTSSPPAGATRRLLKDVAYEHIKALVCDGTFAPGTFISERELAGQLQMSKTPIRAAFERLAEQGFVTIAPQRGVIVRDLSMREISDHFDIRIALETFVARELSGRLGEGQVAALEANLEQQRRQVNGELDMAGWTNSDAAFHLMLAQFLGNEEITRVMERQRDRVQRVVESIGSRDPHIPPLSHAEHRGIYEAIRDGDRALAMTLVERHLQNGKRFLLLGGPYGQQM